MPSSRPDGLAEAGIPYSVYEAKLAVVNHKMDEYHRELIKFLIGFADVRQEQSVPSSQVFYESRAGQFETCVSVSIDNTQYVIPLRPGQWIRLSIFDADVQPDAIVEKPCA